MIRVHVNIFNPSQHNVHIEREGNYDVEHLFHCCYYRSNIFVLRNMYIAHIVKLHIKHSLNDLATLSTRSMSNKT